MCLSGGPEVMHSVVSMKEVCRRVSLEDVEVAFSRDAGRYTSGVHVPNRCERGNVLQSAFSLLKMLAYAVQVAAMVTGVPRVAQSLVFVTGPAGEFNLSPNADSPSH